MEPHCALWGWTGTAQVSQFLSELDLTCTDSSKRGLWMGFTWCLAHLKGSDWTSFSASWQGGSVQHSPCAFNQGCCVFIGKFRFVSESKVSGCWTSFKFSQKAYLLPPLSNYSPQNLGLGFCLLWSLALLREQERRGRWIETQDAAWELEMPKTKRYKYSMEKYPILNFYSIIIALHSISDLCKDVGFTYLLDILCIHFSIKPPLKLLLSLLPITIYTVPLKKSLVLSKYCSQRSRLLDWAFLVLTGCHSSMTSPGSKPGWIKSLPVCNLHGFSPGTDKNTHLRKPISCTQRVNVVNGLAFLQPFSSLHDRSKHFTDIQSYSYTTSTSGNLGPQPGLPAIHTHSSASVSCPIETTLKLLEAGIEPTTFQLLNAHSEPHKMLCQCSRLNRSWYFQSFYVPLRPDVILL